MDGGWLTGERLPERSGNAALKRLM